MALDPNLSIIYNRRSVRVYAPGEISDTTTTQLLQAAMAAPSAMTKDPWRFVIVRERRTLVELAGILPGGKMLATASAAIVACGDIDTAFERQLSFMLQDCSASIQNLLLAAHQLGLGACWVGVHPMEEAIRKLKSLFKLPAPVIPVAVIALGHPGEQLPSRTRFNAEYVHQEIWGPK